ncbi:MAG: hypothetical protein J5835_04170 [Bacteroidales bacterium]|nr:hypothetical protein [Bacteroidales bacterium]
MRRLSIIALALAVFSCTRADYSGLPRNFREQGLSAVLGEPESEKEEEKTASLYVTAVSGGEILLFKDGELIARAPSGSRPDPERHRARGGHLYSDTIEGRRTVIYRDGQELFSYSGEEVLAGFALLDGRLHTLGQRAGGGVSYRINGVELFSADAAQAVGSLNMREWECGAFTVEGEEIYYSYRIPVKTSAGTLWEYRVMKGTETLLVIPASADVTILDIRVLDGEVCRLERSGNRYYYVQGEARQGIIPPAGTSVEMSLVPYMGKLCIKGTSVFRSDEKKCSAWYRMGYSIIEEVAAYGSEIKDHYPGRHYILTRGGKVLRINDGTGSQNLEEGGYILKTPLCTALGGPVFYAALSDTLTGRHLLYSSRGTTIVSLPGYLTSIRLE